MASAATNIIRRFSTFGRQHIGVIVARRSTKTALRQSFDRLSILTTPTLQHSYSTGNAQPCPQKETVSIIFKFPDGSRKTAKAKIGENILDAVLQNHLDIDGYGACEGTLACSTCHLVFSPENFAKLQQKATDEELDMLDLAYGLSDTSRLGCQVIVNKDMDGWEVLVPGGIADARG